MPKVSIIIPVFNAEKYLPTCLNSVVNQTLRNIEIIIINDHSTDNSLDIIREYEKMYPKKIKVIDMVENYGASWARNMGLDIAQGKYIGFVDADDVVSLNMFKDYYKLAKWYGSDIVSGEFDSIYPTEFMSKETFKTSKLHRKTKDNDWNYYNFVDFTKDKTVFYEETPAVWNKLFNHDFLGDTKFLENHIFEDISFTYPLLLKSKKEILEVYRPDYKYRQCSNGVTQSSLNTPRVLDIIDVCLYSNKLARKNNIDEYKYYLLQRKLSLDFLMRISAIAKWDIPINERTYLVNNLLSLYDWYFGHITKLSYAIDIYALLNSIYKKHLITSESEAMQIKNDLLMRVKNFK